MGFKPETKDRELSAAKDLEKKLKSCVGSILATYRRVRAMPTVMVTRARRENIEVGFLPRKSRVACIRGNRALAGMTYDRRAWALGSSNPKRTISMGHLNSGGETVLLKFKVRRVPVIPIICTQRSTLTVHDEGQVAWGTWVVWFPSLVDLIE